MPRTMVRFELIADPDGLWTVWDRENETPLQFSGRPLAGLSEREARCAVEIISEVLRNRANERRPDAGFNRRSASPSGARSV